MLAPDTVLQGRYRVINLISKGGMGSVHLAYDERVSCHVAVKVTEQTEPLLRDAFAREARLLARLRHPCLPRVTDHFAEGARQYLVMDYIPGEDLGQMLKKRRSPFPPDDVLRWAHRLLDALEYLHGQDPPIIHRDIKPPNLKLSPGGEVMLLDFGLAKGATMVSIPGGTLNYAPVEQYFEGGTDARSDIYQFGATLYHLLAGEPPPPAVHRMNELRVGRPDPLTPLAEKDAHIPAAVSQAVQRALAMEPSQRPADARTLKAMLDGAPTDSDSHEPVEGAVPVGAAQGEDIVTDSTSDEDETEVATGPRDDGADSPPPAGRKDVAVNSADPGTSRRYLRPAALALPLLVAAALAGLVWYGSRAQSGAVTTPLVQSEATRQPSTRPTTPANVTQAERTAPSLEFHAPQNLRALAASGNGRLVASLGEDAQLGLWSVADGRRVKTLQGAAADATCVALSPDGEVAAVGKKNGNVLLWRVSDGRMLNQLQAHTDAVDAVGFSRDGRNVLTAGGDGRVRLWRATDGHLERDGKLPEADRERVIAVGGDVVALSMSGAGDELVLRSAEDGRELGRVRLPGEKIVAGALSPDGLTAALLSEKGGARLVRLSDGAVLKSFPALRGDMICFDPVGGTLISGGRDGFVRVWR